MANQWTQDEIIFAAAGGWLVIFGAAYAARLYVSHREDVAEGHASKSDWWWIGLMLFLFHLGMTGIAIASDQWSAVAIAIVNVGLPIAYVPLMRFSMALHNTGYDDPTPWGKLARNIVGFLCGLGCIALATLF